MPATSFNASFPGATVELRRSRRYRLPAPASFLWESPDGSLQQSSGTIRDISDRGAFVTADVVPPTGAHLDVDVHLPSLESGSGAMHLHGEGTVVRVDLQVEGIRGFAAALAFQTEAGSWPTVVSPGKLQ